MTREHLDLSPPQLDAAADLEKNTRVLVVDDEESLCEIACEWVASLGYHAVGAHSGADAIAELEKCHYDVLFTDIVMPGGMDGPELAQRALKRQPHLRILFASGYARGIAEARELGGPLLNKPYRKADLKRALAELIARDGDQLP